MAERPPDRLGTLRECRSAMRAHPSASAHAEGSGSGRCWGVDTGGIPLSPSEPEPHSEHARGASRSLGDRNPNSPVRSLFRPPYFKRRARNWRAARFRVNALASRPGRSRFAAGARRFATRGCVRGGLAGWARGEVPPVLWPTVAGGSADCLSGHRETLPVSSVSV